MRIKMLALAAMLVALPVAAPAETLDVKQPVIVVAGDGHADQPPDHGTFTYELRGEGKTEVASLQALSAVRVRVEQGLLGMSGVTRAEIKPSDLAMVPVRSPDCKDDDENTAARQLSTGPCAISGYVATMKATASITPPERTGDGISLASELGAANATLGDWEVDDLADLQSAAAKDAIAKARARAEQIAAASAVRLGSVVRIEDGHLRAEGGITDLYNLHAPMPAALIQPRPAKPSAPIDLKPQPVEVDATYVVTYAIQP
jgi:uncharacterized protein YggE